MTSTIDIPIKPLNTPQRWMREYHTQMVKSIKSGWIRRVQLYLDVGVDPNWTMGYDSFLVYAISSEKQGKHKMIKLLLDHGSKVDGLKTFCQHDIHSTEIFNVACILDNFRENLDIFRTLMETYSSDPIKQIEYLNMPCSDCDCTAFDMVHFLNGTSPRTENLYCLIQLGATVPPKRAQVMMDDAIEVNHLPMISWLLKHTDVEIKHNHIWNAMVPDSKRLPSIQLPKSILLEMIDRLSSVVDSKPAHYPTKCNLLHGTILLGDTDIIMHLLSKSDGMLLLEELDKNGKTALQLAPKQGVILNVLIVFQATVQHYATKYKLNVMRNKSLMDRCRTCLDGYELVELDFDRAKHEFYTYLFNEINQLAIRLDPLTDQEPFLRILSRLIDDFYYPSGIGFPDENTAYLTNLMDINSDEQIDETIRVWAETNPLAAMRWYYAKQMQSPTRELPVGDTGSLDAF